MSAKVDIANISADRGRSFFANAGCTNTRTVEAGDGHGSAVSFTECPEVHQYDKAEREKYPETEKNQRYAFPRRHYSVSLDDRNAAGKQQRRYSDKFTAGAAAFAHRRRGGRMGRHQVPERLRERIVLPTRFLLGGNITDPLNLNSLCDDEVNKSMNETTPISSPVPVPVHRMEVKVLVPVNSADPLNLNATDSDTAAQLKQPNFPGPVFPKQRKRNRRRKRNVVTMDERRMCLDLNRQLEVAVVVKKEIDQDLADDDTNANCTRPKRVLDHIVSPVVPQRASKWKRRRTASDSRTETEQSCEAEMKVEKTVVQHKKRHMSAYSARPMHFRAKDRKFSHGNYSMRGTELGDCEDVRLAYFSKEMFAGKDVLDVGCGIGHIALFIARNFDARSVIGMDISQKVISVAQKNKRHFASATLPDSMRFPVSIRQRLGPLAAPHSLLPMDKFPRSVSFQADDYVPQSEEELGKKHGEYDVILGLRITKWVHLNYGDAGLKRMFQRMYKELRPGGLLVLEMQPWKAYRKKRKLTEHIYQTYRRIAFHPDSFADYLLSREVGFASSERLRAQFHRHIGLRQPLMAFRKSLREPMAVCGSQSLVSVSSQLRSSQLAKLTSAHATPDRSPVWTTPKFEIGSASCSTTPCSTQCRNTPSGVDDRANAVSPYSSQSSSSSAGCSCGQPHASVDPSYCESSLEALSDSRLVAPCDQQMSYESRTTSATATETETRHHGSLPSMHPDCVVSSTDTQQLRDSNV